MIRDVRFLLSTFSRRDRARLVLYVTMQFGLALLDLVGIAAVLPIVQIVSGAPLDDGYIGTVHSLLGEPSRAFFVVLLVSGMVLAFTAKSVLGLAVQWWSMGLINRLQALTASRLIRAYLRGSYHQRRSGTLADIGRFVDTGVSDAHGKVLGSLLGMTSALLSTALVLIFLVIVQPLPALVAVLYFGIAVFAMQRLLGNRNHAAGKAAIDAAWERSHSIIDVVDGFREVRMHNAEDNFANRFDRANAHALQVSRRAGILGSIPRYAIELITIIGIALLLAMSVFTMDAAELMTVMGLFIAVAIRLLPTVSGFTAQIGTLRNGQPGLALVTAELRRLDAAGLLTSPTAVNAHVRKPVFEQLAPLEIENVHFRYPGTDHDVLEEISFTVPPGSSLALLGMSGSGKTTLVDTILGLHEPRLGSIRYGDRSIRELDADWRDLVAYVPQDVYIVDDTILTNVAFGEDSDSIDVDRALEALDRAHLGELVASLPDGVHTRVGARGTRLSGGQRQRLGIARALYRQPSVIVLDEATSALDNRTELEISQAIASLHGEVTIIQIAHRLSTVRNADRVVYLQHGRIAAAGTFAEVQAAVPEFAQLVTLGHLKTEVDPDSGNTHLEESR